MCRRALSSISGDRQSTRLHLLGPRHGEPCDSAGPLCARDRRLWSSMKLLIVDTYYSGVLDHLYAETPGLQSRSYAEQWRLVMDQCFGTADFYSEGLGAFCDDYNVIV